LYLLMLELLRKEKEQPFASGVELGQEKRTADGIPGDVVSIRGSRAAGLVGEKVIRTQGFMPVVPARGAMKLLAAPFGDHIDRASGIAAVLGCRDRHHHLHFSDRIHRGHAADAAVRAVVEASD